MNIKQEVIKVRSHYVQAGRTPNFYEINNGFCEEFAMALLEKMGGYSDVCFELCGENFMMGEDGSEYENDVWCGALLESEWKITPPCQLTWAQMDEIHFGNHTWLYYQGKHYDAECSEGTENFFDLPVLKRYILRYCKEKNIAHNECLVTN